MLLRYLVGHYLRNAAKQQFMDTVARAAEEEGDSQPSENQSQPLPPCEVACLFALGIESSGLVELLNKTVMTRCASYLENSGLLDQRPIVVADGGVGAEAAARATDDLIAIHHPQWIVSAGFAGALCKDLRRGQILMADTVVNGQQGDSAGQQLSIPLKMGADVIARTKGLHMGRLLTVDRLISEPAEKKALGEKYQALACDMETFAVAEVCRQRKTRFLSVRVITDAVDEQLPPEIEGLLEQKSIAGKLGAAAGAIFNRPSTVKDMWRLREEALKASDRLAKFLSGVIPQLPDRDQS